MAIGTVINNIAKSLLETYDDNEDTKLEIGGKKEVNANRIADDVIDALEAAATDLGDIKIQMI